MSMKSKLLLFCFFVFPVGWAIAEDWIAIPVVINVVDSSDASKVDEAIKKANEALAKAKIRLEVVKKNQPFNVGNNDANLGEGNGEHDEALEKGGKELEKTCGAGKGLKITVADDVWAESPNTNGWAIHRDPVVFVEGGESDPNKLGKTIAHEIAHSLTLGYDLYDGNDPNRLMWGYDDRGSNLSPAEVNEIRKQGEQRGRPQVITKKVMPGGAVAVPADPLIKVQGYGGVVDSFFDVFCTAPGFNPRDHDFRYADLREVTIFWNRPFDLSSNIIVSTRLGGCYPIIPSSFFDVFLEISLNIDPDPSPDGRITMHIWRDGSGGGIINHMGTYQNLHTGLTDPFDMVVHLNDKFDGIGGAQPANNSLECTIPAMLIFNPASYPGYPLQWPFTAECMLTATDVRLGAPLSDSTPQFEFSLNQPLEGPRISLVETYGGGGDGKVGVCVSGLPSLKPVQVFVDDILAGAAQTAADGTVMTFVEAALVEQGNHQIQIRAETIDPLEPAAISYTTATGYLTHCTAGQIEGDLDNDCDVDFVDFAVLADNWLVGKAPI